MKTGSSKPNDNINLLNFVEYPVRSLIFLLKKLKLENLFKQHINDPRYRVDKYSLVSLLMMGLFTHLFRSPSKNEFFQHLLRPNRRSLAKLAGIQSDELPCARTIDDAFAKLDQEQLKPILPAIFHFLYQQKVFRLHPEFTSQGQFLIAIDGQVTHIYYDHSQHPCRQCEYCLKRTRGDKVWYLHFDLVASLITPAGLQIPLLFHRIKARSELGDIAEKDWKQECERTAIPYILNDLHKMFPRLSFCILLDALYATDPCLTLLKRLKMGYAIVQKKTVLTTVENDCEGLKSLIEPVNRIKIDGHFNVTQKIYFFNEVIYKRHHLNIIHLDEEQQKRPSKRFAKIQSKKTHWQWIVHKNLSKYNISKIVDESRLRWKQEDLFNSLQKRGFAIEHDFNRLPKIQTIRIYLILIAFALTSILTNSRLGIYIFSKKSIRFTMEQMLDDLVYIDHRVIFDCPYPIQFRFGGKDPPQK